MVWMRMTPLSWTALWCAVTVAALLGGCVASRPAQKANSSLLLSVVIAGEQAMELEPAALAVTLDDISAGTTRQFVFDASSRIPGHRAEFLIRMEVPAGQHRLSRVSGAAADGAVIAGLDFTFEIDVEARARATDYLGHMEMRSSASRSDAAVDAARLVIVDAYEDDWANFVHAWPELSRRRVGRRAPPEVTPVSLLQNANEEHARAAPLDVAAASHLPRRTQMAFQSFLKSKYPRAIAVGPSGVTGIAAGGTNVIGRALRECKRAQVDRPKSCKLFALDDTLVQSMDGSSGTTGAVAGK